MTISARKSTTALLLVTIVSIMAGCSASTSDTTATILPPADRPLDLVFGDCSKSFEEQSSAFVPEMVKIAESSALSNPRRKFWAGCVDGAPLRTLDWNPTIDFSEEPKELRSNPAMGDRVAVARAIGLSDKLKSMLKTAPIAEGSGQLEALELASETPGVGRVFFYTDAVINEIEGVDLKDATPEEIERAVQLWLPRVRNLAGADLMFIGVGRGARRSKVVRNAKTLFSKLATAVGVRSFEWSLELPANFETGAE